VTQSRPWPVLAAIGAGGALGSLARFGVEQVIPTVPGGFPWSTFVVNIAGCLLIGSLMVLVTEVRTRQRLLRPFLGVGVLGGFTTFSFHVLEAHGLFEARQVATAMAYLSATPVVAVLAAYAGMTATRRLIGAGAHRSAS
jgi:fluoride exporter